ncbi:MAG TPA: DNA-binding protein [Methylomirabilota bacterium]|nr:DNA-binding protein [Methylomirabilota bacterium]
MRKLCWKLHVMLATILTAVVSTGPAAASESMPYARKGSIARREIGCVSLDQIASAREDDLPAPHGMGPKAIGIIGAALKATGESF